MIENVGECQNRKNESNATDGFDFEIGFARQELVDDQHREPEAEDCPNDVIFVQVAGDEKSHVQRREKFERAEDEISNAASCARWCARGSKRLCRSDWSG